MLLSSPNMLHFQFATSDFGPSFSGGRNGRFPRESMAETKARAAVECADEADAAIYECVAENAAERVSVATEVSVVGEWRIFHYRVRHHFVLLVPLVSNQKLWFSIGAYSETQLII